ncbi:MAG: competence protein CoiA [Bacillota bacterium]
MFVAFDEKGIIVNVTEKKWSKQLLRRIREQSNFFCPVCSNELELKIGTIITAHFAHKKLTGCTMKSEAESQYHLQGKLDLYEWLQDQSKLNDVQLEPYISEIKQRPDILFRNREDRIPIEFQCSTIDSKTFIKRTSSYLELQMEVFWILGAKTLKRTGSRSFLLSPFQWLFAEISNNGDPPKIFSYCTISKSFIVLYSIIPFSPRSIFTVHQQYSIQSKNYDELKSPMINKQQIHTAWFDNVRRFRLKSSNYKTKESAYLNMYLYKTKQLSLSYLPPLAFLPLNTSYLIESPVYVWQGWILVYIDNLPLNRGFSFQDVCHFIGKKISERKIRIRRLPQIKLHYSYVIKEYLSHLCLFFIIKQTKKNMFIKKSNIQWITNLENLLSDDEGIREKLNQHFK